MALKNIVGGFDPTGLTRFIAGAMAGKARLFKVLHSRGL